jgi:hypothetical protein
LAAPAANVTMESGDGMPSVPARMAQMQSRVLSAKNSAPP